MKIGVIDIGYNAIRAVAYENDKIGAREIFNQKFKNDTLNLLAREKLSIKHQTYVCISYLLDVFKKLEITKIKCVATAVLREHPRSAEFVQYIKENYTIDIQIISGEQEARYSANGLISAIPDANGIAVDLGGGSLEFAEINHGIIGDTQSLELGTKVAANKNLTSIEEIEEVILEKFGEKTYSNIYMIGGALRFICRNYIEYSRYPLKNLHHLAISTEEFSNYLDYMIDNGPARLGKRKINSSGLMIAKAMINIFQPTNIIASIYGLKEGVHLDLLDEKERSKDLILEKLFCNFSERATKIVFHEYYTHLEKIAGSILVPYKNLLQYAQIILSSRVNFDQTIAPKALAESVLCSEIPLKHKDRVMLALVVYYSSSFKLDPNIIKLSKKMLSKQDNLICQIIGNYFKICAEVDGAEFSSPSFSIIAKNTFLEIETTKILPRPTFEAVRDKLKSIAFLIKFLKEN